MRIIVNTYLMKESYRELGMYDIKSKVVIWRCPLPNLKVRRPLEVKVNQNPNLWLVWLDYHPNKEQGLRVSLTRAIGGELVDGDYNLSRTTTPSRYKLTQRGSEYLRTFDKYFNPGDTITLSLLRLKVGTGPEIWESNDTLWMRYIPIAIRSEVK